ncbi:hypothetical protein SAMN06265348_10731 [Pedobacter westerhofensis]|uniref:Uncharacterized protein n=1 Tax=Pedobacter westerhofensis TaxID=425512 RepID=A0A521E520_9SPHI|nr:hypothetical protein [Pedobacter westerhofensis]SMO78952.1 hypothetical protein SAMN06265348_10731 [Pedobacter westerhofensis]
MSFICFVLQTIPFMMLVIIALGQTDLRLFRKVSDLITRKMKIKPAHDKKRVILDKGKR